MTPEEAEATWPQCKRDYWFYGGPGYDAYIEKMPWEAIIETGDHDYQGSSSVCLKDGERYGYLEYGWGSCSGCDADQACDSWSDVADLYNSLVDNIEWHDSIEAFLTWAKSHDWKGEWSWHDGAKEFCRELNKEFGLELELE